MATIQKLYEVCKVSLSTNAPLSSEAVDSICAVLGKKCPFLTVACDLILKQTKMLVGHVDQNSMLRALLLIRLYSGHVLCLYGILN